VSINNAGKRIINWQFFILPEWRLDMLDNNNSCNFLIYVLQCQWCNACCTDVHPRRNIATTIDFWVTGFNNSGKIDQLKFSYHHRPIQYMSSNKFQTIAMHRERTKPNKYVVECPGTSWAATNCSCISNMQHALIITTYNQYSCISTLTYLNGHSVGNCPQ